MSASPKKGLGLLVLSAGSKDKDPFEGDEKESPEEDASEGDAGEFAELAFDALKDDDKDAFVRAFKGAVEACMSEYGDDSDEKE